MAGPAMGALRKILIFIVMTAGIILIGKLAPRVLPDRVVPSEPPNATLSPDSLLDSTNALPPIAGDTTGGKWHEKLFNPLLRAYGLRDNALKQRNGFWEIVFPKGKPIHEYALQIENTCRANGIAVRQGVELRPVGRSVEYVLESQEHHIKLRASLGAAFMSGSAKIAIVFTGLDSLKETRLAALESAPWDKSLSVNPYSPNPVLKKLRFTQARNEVLVELPMEPSTYPYLNPGKQALFIHHSKEDVDAILSEALDSLPKAAGFVSKYGDRAIENQPLLENLFRFTAAHKLAFLDLTGSPRSLARQTAANMNALSRTATVFKESVLVQEELAHKAALAQKTGDAVLVLPYTESAFRILDKTLAENAIRFNEIGLEFVTYSSLLAARPDTLTAAAKPAAAKPTAAKPTATKPAVAKPTAAKPTAAKPTATKPAVAKPTAAKPKAAKPVVAGAKPSKGNPGSKSKPSKEIPASKTKPVPKAKTKPSAKPAPVTQ